MTHIRGFKPVFITIGVIYTLLASSMLVRGPTVLLDFSVPQRTVSDPILQDFFTFFYLLMAFVGVLTVLFGHVTRERRTQLTAAGVFFVWNIVTALRDLSTSDCQLGSRLYKGEGTVVLVFISVAQALAFGALVLQGLRSRPT